MDEIEIVAFQTRLEKQRLNSLNLDNNGRDDLLVAVSQNNLHLVAKLMSEEKLKLIDKFDRNALMTAAEYGYADMIKLIIDSCDLSQRGDKFKRNPLHIAVAEGHEECVKVLIDYFNPFELDSLGSSSLEYALKQGKNEITKHIYLGANGKYTKAIDEYVNKVGYDLLQMFNNFLDNTAFNDNEVKSMGLEEKTESMVKRKSNI